MYAAGKSLINEIIQRGIVFSLIILWVYAAISKLLDHEASRATMLNQYPALIANILIWAIPAVELAAASLLIINRTQLAGLKLSLFLLILFSLYIALVMMNVFGRIPCSCGGILEKMSWGQHLVFNLLFLLLTLIALLQVFKERRMMGKEQRENQQFV